VQQLSTLGQIIASESTAAVAFDNQEDATEVLSALRAERPIVGACIYDKRGRLFSRYPADAAISLFPTAPQADGYSFMAGHLVGFTPIAQKKGSGRLGTLYLNLSMEALYQRLRLYGEISALVIGMSLLVAYVLSRKLQKQISLPVLALAETAKAISDRRDYSVRAIKLGDDELGLLTDTFNHMLGQIQQQNAELEKRVRERTAELEAANDELEAFCSSAAHDLRTPLRAITGFADILLRAKPEALAPNIRRCAEMIYAGSEEMSTLIEDLLNFSRLGRQALSRKPIDLEVLFRDVFESLESELKDRRVQFQILPLPRAFGDHALLRVVAINLLSNALKYSRPRDPATIEIGTASLPEEVGPVFYVKDNGVGFDMRHTGKLFGVFQRLHHAHEFEGTGVGLATVRRIIERHGGRIWAEAAPELGATFFFTLAAEIDRTSSSP
jgi:signal transduction histidine kinase